jgi:hypothetical protein
MKLFFKSCFLLLLSISARADFIAVGSFLDRSTQTLSSVMRVNENTGEAHTIGNSLLDGLGVRSLTRDPQSNAFYTVRATSPNTVGLYSVDPLSGTFSLVVQLSQNLLFTQALAGAPQGGFLYATHSNDDTLYTINETTGQVSALGHLGSDFSDVRGLAFNPAGQLYGYTGFDSEGHGPDPGLFTVDLATLTPTVITTNRRDVQTVEDIAFSPDGRLWGIVGPRVQKFDPVTGIFLGYLDIPGFGGTYNGIAFLPETPVPEPGPAVLVGLGILGLAVFSRSRLSRLCRSLNR